METPAADIRVTEALVEQLVAEQQPDLAGPLRLVASGWDNVLYQLGHDYVVRLPRRREAAELIVGEQRWLADIAKRVDTRLPVPVRMGKPSQYYPWHWSICEWIDGTPAGNLTPVDLAPIALPLAEFIAQLQVPAPISGERAPANPVRGVPLAMRSDAVLARLEHGVGIDPEPLRALWAESLSVPHWSGAPLWLHGDLHPANIIVSRRLPELVDLVAIIDFGDLTSGDPATDLAAAWLVFEPDARAVFRTRLDQLGVADSDTWRRARGWALCIASAMAAHSDDDPRMAAIGRHGLHQVLLDE